MSRRYLSRLNAPQRGLGTRVAEEPPRLGKREVTVLWQYLRPYKRTLFAAVGFLIASSALKLAGPFFIRSGIDDGISAGDLDKFNLFGAGFVVASIAAFFALRYATLYMGKAGEQSLRDLRIGAFAHLTSLSMGLFERERSGRLVSRVTSDVESAEKLVTDHLSKMATELLFMAGAIISLMILDFRLALAALSVTPVMYIATKLFKRRSAGIYREVRERVASVLTYFQETLRGMQVVQAFATERFRAERFKEVNDDWADVNVSAFRLESTYFPTMQWLGVLGTGVVLIVGGLVLADDLSPGVLTAFVVYLTLFFEPMHHLTELYARLQEAKAGLARVAQLLGVPAEVTDAPGAVPMSTPRGHVRMDDVVFSYGPGLEPALQGITVDIQPGETVALVGPTGAGKSTVVKLLARFYDASEGEITIDGIEIRRIQLTSLRKHLGLVTQEGFLFGGTIRDNVRFGRPEATDIEVEEVCRKIDIDDFIRSLPDAYETDIHEQGARLSSGERQLIALARAVISEPSIVLLDEATSSLDSATESRIEGAFRRALSGRTSIVIAHRLSTVMHADRILVVERGQIVETGSHTELLTKRSRYAALYEYWLAGGRPESESA